MTTQTATTTTRAPRQLAGTRVGIPPRQVNYPLTETMRKNYFGDNALATQFISVLSVFFPPGEMFFVNSVKNFRKQVTDQKLKDQVAGFIGQEALHTREHDRLNEQLKGRGMNISMPDKAVRVALWALEKFAPTQQLACTGLMEHFTALLGEQLLDNPRLQEQFDEEILNLWLWHALEELEHKSVAYDVYDLVGNSQAERKRSFALVGATVVPALLVSWAYVAIQDGQLKRPKDTVEGLRLLFGKHGFVSSILPKMGLYARRDFHPDKHDTRKVERTWRTKLFGKRGELTDTLGNREAVTLQ